MRNQNFIPRRPAQFSNRPTAKFKFDFTISIFGIVFLSLPFIIGWERLNSITSSRGAPLGEAALAVGAICLMFGILDFAIRLFVFALRRIR